MICLCLLPMLAGCLGKPAAEDFFYPFSLEQRQMQTRFFKTQDEIKVLAACASLLQDNGFQIAEAESRLGLLASSKVKMNKFGAIQTVSVNVVTHPVSKSIDTVAVRVIFRYATAGNYGLVIVQDSTIYQEFFTRLAKALFLEAQQI